MFASFLNIFRKHEKIIVNPTNIAIQKRHDDPNASWWVTLEYHFRDGDWRLIRQYESAYDPTYPSPGCSLDYQFHDDFAMALLNCIERRAKGLYHGWNSGQYKYQLYLTNGHGQVLRWFERIFVIDKGEPKEPEKMSDMEIHSKIHKRIVARAIKDFEEADRIRDELLKENIEIQDFPDGTSSWSRK